MKLLCALHQVCLLQVIMLTIGSVSHHKLPMLLLGYKA